MTDACPAQIGVQPSGHREGGKALDVNAPGDAGPGIAVVPSPSPQSPLSIGFAWAYRISALGLEFSLPALLGFLLDRRWDTSPAATLVGACLGFAAGMYHLIQLSSRGRPGRRPE